MFTLFFTCSATPGVSISATKHSSKTKVVCSMIKRLSRENPGRKFLVFSAWTMPMTILKNLLAMEGFRAAQFNGGISMSNRTKLLDSARNDNLDVLLINYEAGGKALNMEFSDTVILFDPPYNEATADQATFRARRLDQKMNVTRLTMVSQNTMEEWMLNLAYTKEAKKEEWAHRTDSRSSERKKEEQDAMFAYYSRRDRSVCPPNAHFDAHSLPPPILPETCFDQDEDNLPSLFYSHQKGGNMVMSGKDYLDSAGHVSYYESDDDGSACATPDHQHQNQTNWMHRNDVLKVTNCMSVDPPPRRPRPFRKTPPAKKLRFTPLDVEYDSTDNGEKCFKKKM